MRALLLMTVLVLLCGLGSPAPASHGRTPSGWEPMDMCEELDLVPCPDALRSVLPDEVDVFDLGNNCRSTVTRFGPLAQFSGDPFYGPYVIRAYAISVTVDCRKPRDLVAVAEAIPATNTDFTRTQQAITCSGALRCNAQAGWSRRDVYGVAPPICYSATAIAMADTQTFGPFVADNSIAGFRCVA